MAGKRMAKAQHTAADWLHVDVGTQHYAFHRTHRDPDNKLTAQAVALLRDMEQLRQWRMEVLAVGQHFHAEARRDALTKWALGRGNYHPDTVISGVEYAWLPTDYQNGLRTNARAISAVLDEGLRLWRLAGRRRLAFIRMLQGVPKHGSRY